MLNSAWDSNLKYGFKLEFQVELLIIWESVEGVPYLRLLIVGWQATQKCNVKYIVKKIKAILGPILLIDTESWVFNVPMICLKGKMSVKSEIWVRI